VEVFAIDSKGASTSGDTSGFDYTDPATGTMTFYTKEKIITATTMPIGGPQKDTILSVSGRLKCRLRCSAGPWKPRCCFIRILTDILIENVPKASYRITAIKSGYESSDKNNPARFRRPYIVDTFYLKRPDATVYGKVVDNTITA
jgi:hypothetical protein